MRTRLRSSGGLLGVALAASLLFAGCAQVKPYEREYLSRPGMDLAHEGFAERFEVHVHEAREGALGSSGESAGGGCGCN